MKLGRIAPTKTQKNKLLRLKNYIAPLPQAPDSCDVTSGITQWPMYLNDRLGDCTCAAIAHANEVFTCQVSGSARLVTDDDVLAVYESQGYNPNDPNTDQGANELSVLDYWRKTGIAGDTLFAYAGVDTTNNEAVKEACWLFYGLYIGINLPLTAQGQDAWDIVDSTPDKNGAGTWGGHAVNVVAYDANGLTVVTWGSLKRMTWNFWNEYVDEAYALIPQGFDKLGTNPLGNGFNVDQLKTDLISVGAINE